MRSDLTDITVVLDRSGSMINCRSEAEGGLNAFVIDQKTKEGECRFSLLQFDDTIDWVVVDAPIKGVPEYKLHPRGWTALLDAIGHAIESTGARLAKMDESQRPGLVTVVIVTDGEENSSREYNHSAIREMIRHQQDVYGWQFTFLGANQDAFRVSREIGISPNATANYSTKMSGNAFRAASSSVSRMRSASIAGLDVVCDYSADERKSMTSH